MSAPYSGSIKYFKAFLQILEIWASENVGNEIEVDFEKLWAYVSSENGILRKVINTDRNNSEEALFKLVENDIIDGCPVWEFLIIPEWTKRMLEIEFSKTIEQAKIDNINYLKQFICTTCEHLITTELSLGTVHRCNCRERRGIVDFERVFELQKKCKFYKEKI